MRLRNLIDNHKRLKQFFGDKITLSKESVSEADNDAIWLFEFVYKMIANRGFVGKELEKRVEGAYNLLKP